MGKGWGAARAPRVAGGERRRHGVTVKTEREERERWSEGKLVNNSKFLASNEKLLNTKVVQNFEIYNFCFRHKFI